jgi:hypothetical protein
MSRSPLFYPLNRGMDAEAGGVADLQTDVMRFIAILSLCLVAIFALVQSIPLMPTLPVPPVQQIETKQVPQAVEIVEQPIVAEPSPQKREEEPLVITRPAPKRITVNRAPQRIIEQTVETVQVPVSAKPVPVVPVQPVPDTPAPLQSEGFTLRFETDLALTRLVARNEVGLYAITPDKTLRMNVNRGSFGFWPASVPNQFHEMAEGTVPEDVLSALQRSGSAATSDVKWGVTLPNNMRNDLDKFVSEFTGGSLIIGGDGKLRLEP